MPLDRAHRSAPSYCGCAQPLDGDYVEGACCQGHISSRMGDFEPYRFNATAAYAGRGTARIQKSSAVSSRTVSSGLETLLAVDPEHETMYQRVGGYMKSETWYFGNGSYVVQRVDGAKRCLYTAHNWDDQVRYHADAMFRVGHQTPKEFALRDKLPPDDLACIIESWVCENAQRDTYTGTPVDATSCDNRMSTAYGVQHTTGFIEWMSVDFHAAPGSRESAFQSMFLYSQVVPLHSEPWAAVPALPAICSDPLPLCPTLFPEMIHAL